MALSGGVAENALSGAAEDVNPFSLGSSAGLGPLQANANLGLFQIPISASFLNPSATTTFSPTSYYNPTVTQGALSNSLILGPQFGGGQSSSSSIFGGGGGGGGSGGGDVANNINYSPTTTISQSLPGVPGFSTLPNILQGNASQNIVTQGNAMPSFMGGGGSNPLIGNISPPIAAGGFLPMLPYPMNQQEGNNGQQIMPGSSSTPAVGSSQQAGGYPSPPQPPPQPAMAQMQAPQGMSMQQRLAGAANPMAMALLGDPQQGQMDGGSPLTAGAGRAVAPDQPISQSAQDTIDELERLKGQVSPAAAAAIDNFTKSAAAKLMEHKANKNILEPKLQEAEAKVDAIRKDAHDQATAEGNARALQDTEQAIFDRKTPAEQSAIRRGLENFKYRGAAHPKLRTALSVTGMLGNTGIARAARAMDAHMTTAEKTEEQRDDDAASKFLTEVHSAMSERHANMATDLTAGSSEVNDFRTQLSHNDQTLRQGLENSKDLYMAPGQMKLEALGKEASMTEHQATTRGQGVREAEIPFQQSMARGNLAANQQRANTGSEALGLAQEKFNKVLSEASKENSKKDLQIQALQQQAKYAPFLPKTQTGYDQFRNNTLGLIKNGTLSRQDANKLMQMAISEGHLADVPEAK